MLEDDCMEGLLPDEDAHLGERGVQILIKEAFSASSKTIQQGSGLNDAKDPVLIGEDNVSSNSDADAESMANYSTTLPDYSKTSSRNPYYETARVGSEPIQTICNQCRTCERSDREPKFGTLPGFVDFYLLKAEYKCTQCNNTTQFYPKEFRNFAARRDFKNRCEKDPTFMRLYQKLEKIYIHGDQNERLSDEEKNFAPFPVNKMEFYH